MQYPKLSLRTIAMLTMPPLMWAGNAIVGRMLVGQVPPMTLNFVRWALASVLLLPLAPWLLRRDSGFAKHWKHFALLGLVGVGLYNSLQYLALNTSSPMNVTLVASSSPLFMMVVGALFFGAKLRRTQVLGAVLSIAGVALVLSRGQWSQLMSLQLVPGDLFMMLAALTWAFYSWMLTLRKEPEAIRNNWAAMLLAQTIPGSLWAGLFTAAEWTWGNPTMQWNTQVALALAFIVIGPAVLAYRAWGLGVQAAGPTLAAFFTNLTPLFTAVLSTLILREWPHWYHVVAFALIAASIWISSLK